MDKFFERALALVHEAVRLLGAKENQEDDVEYCITRLESLLSNCLNVMRVPHTTH